MARSQRAGARGPAVPRRRVAAGGARRLAAGDANTYEAHPSTTVDAAGPDEVGAHAAARSPFDVDDLVGNVWELARGPGGYEMRGGAWFYPQYLAQVVNRQAVEPGLRDPLLGARICATP